MTRDELIAAVLVQFHNGTPYFIRMVDVPEPWRDQFLRASADRNRPRPNLEGELDLQIAFAYDWQNWVHHSWYGKKGPVGLDAPEEIAKISRNPTDEFIAELNDGRVLINSNEVLVLSFWESPRALSSEQKNLFMNKMHC